MKRSEILEKARQCVCEDRDRQYGHPEDNFGKIAELWSAYRGEYFPVRDVAMMMALVKIARIYAGESVDSYVDLAGYAACGGELATEKKGATKECPATKQSKRKDESKPHGGSSHNAPVTKLYKGVGEVFLSFGSLIPRKRYYFRSDGKWIGIDNHSGDAWVEEFDSVEDCLAWLRGESDIWDDEYDDENDDEEEED